MLTVLLRALEVKHREVVKHRDIQRACVLPPHGVPTMAGSSKKNKRKPWQDSEDEETDGGMKGPFTTKDGRTVTYPIIFVFPEIPCTERELAEDRYAPFRCLYVQKCTINFNILPKYFGWSARKILSVVHDHTQDSYYLFAKIEEGKLTGQKITQHKNFINFTSQGFPEERLHLHCST